MAAVPLPLRVKRILFACVGNAMRSQMAEGLGRHLARPGTVEIRSGGTQPAGFVHPRAVRAMKERGVDISGHTSKIIDLTFAESADAVISLCGPLDDACPRKIIERTLDWSMPDPSWGGDEEVRKVRDRIEAKIVQLYQEWGVLREDGRGGPKR